MQPHKVKDQQVEGGSQNQVQLTNDSLALFDVRTTQQHHVSPSCGL